MDSFPKPLFDTYESFLDQDFSAWEPQNPYVAGYLLSFPDEFRPLEGFQAVRSFLRAYSDTPATFSSYRTPVERLLLWALLIKKKSLFALKRQDVQDYLDFCRSPLPSWIGPVTRSRFVNNVDAGSDIEFAVTPNPNWRPFNYRASKLASTDIDQKVNASDNQINNALSYNPTKGTMAQVFSICSRFL